jgi:putative radical SAM enzyme (TIGR03279 family)
MSERTVAKRRPAAEPPDRGDSVGGVRVESVAAGSPAMRAGIGQGDRILSVSGEKVADLLDLHFLTSRGRFRLRWVDSAGETREKVFRPADAGLGIHPEPIRVRRCRNRCVFCFVHQLPRGLRRSLYVKDEDVRLSFLHGQYVTFSDITEEETRKILRYRLSPLYVSIHTVDAALRRKMLGNPEAADILGVMKRLIRGGIVLHGQIVVCPGVNDGDELERSLRTLMTLRPGLSTVAVVPVGLTAHRQGLPALRPVSRREAGETLAMLGRIRRESGNAEEEPFAAAADEYYLIAGKRIPGRKAYGSFAQIGNGVGLLRQFLDSGKVLFRKSSWPRAAEGGTVVTGLSARRHVEDFLYEFSRRSGARFDPLPVENRLMGRSVTVTGLLGGRDILDALKRRKASKVYLPSVTLRDAGDILLDNLTPGDIAREAGAEVRVFEATPRGFFHAVHGPETSII